MCDTIRFLILNWSLAASGEWIEAGYELRQTDPKGWLALSGIMAAELAAELVRSIGFGVQFEGDADRIC